MFELLLALFLLGTLVMVVRIFASAFHAHTMPWSCPRCYSAMDTDLLDRLRDWYIVLSDGRYQCRHCHTVFREHPNGALVEDR
jgi:rubredoxin